MKRETSKWYGHEWSKDLTECIKHFSGNNSIRQLKMDVLYIQNPQFKLWIECGCRSQNGIISDDGESRIFQISQDECKLLKEYLYS